MKKIIFVFTVFLAFMLSGADDWLWDVAGKDPALTERLLAGQDIWASYIDGDGTVHFRVRADRDFSAQMTSTDTHIVKIRQVSFVSASSLPAEEAEYHSVDDTLGVLEQLESEYAGHVKQYAVGKTVEKKDIPALKISAVPGENVKGKTEVVITGLMHAREWIGLEVILRLAMFLGEQYDANPRIKDIVDRSEIWLIPMVNRDGYLYSWEKDRYWRKNRRDNGNGSRGVDINRNFAAEWGVMPGSDHDTASEGYCGPSVFSEPETAALRDLMGESEFSTGNLVDEVAGFLDYHSFSQYILYPYGMTDQLSPEYVSLKERADTMASLIAGVAGEEYLPMQGRDLYIMKGVGLDWFHITHGFKPSYAIELRPSAYSSVYDFNLPPEFIKVTARENIPAALYFIETLIYQTTDIDTDINKDGVNDYLAGCADSSLCGYLYDPDDPRPEPDDTDTDSDMDAVTGPDSDQGTGIPDSEVRDDSGDNETDTDQPDNDTGALKPVTNGCSVSLI